MEIEKQLVKHYTVNLLSLASIGDNDVKRVAKSLIKLLKLNESLVTVCEKCGNTRQENSRLCDKCFTDTIFGNKRNYPKIDIFQAGKYQHSTTWVRTCKEAIEKSGLDLENGKITANFSKK